MMCLHYICLVIIVLMKVLSGTFAKVFFLSTFEKLYHLTLKLRKHQKGCMSIQLKWVVLMQVWTVCLTSEYIWPVIIWHVSTCNVSEVKASADMPLWPLTPWTPTTKSSLNPIVHLNWNEFPSSHSWLHPLAMTALSWFYSVGGSGHMWSIIISASLTLKHGGRPLSV